MDSQLFRALLIVALATAPFVIAQIMFMRWLHKAQKLRDEIKQVADQYKLLTRDIVQSTDCFNQAVAKFNEALNKDRAIRMAAGVLRPLDGDKDAN